MSNSITNRQMVMILFLTLTSYSVLNISKSMAQTAGTGSWFTIILTAAIFGIAAIVIVSLNHLFQDKMLLEYTPQIVSKPVSYLISAFYILYIFFIIVFLVTINSRLLKVEFFPKTPLWAFPAICLPVFCYIAYRGITNVARLAEIFGTVYLITGVLAHFLMATQGKVNRILPLFNTDQVGQYFGAIQTSFFAFLGIDVLLAMPLQRKNAEKSNRTAFLSLISIGLFYILVVESCIMKIGIHDIVVYDDSLIVAIRDTSSKASDLLTRLDIVYLTVGIGTTFVHISIMLTVMVEYVSKTVPRIRRSVVVLILGILVYIVFFFVKGLNDYEDIMTQAGFLLGIISMILIPLVLFIIAKVRKLGVKVKKNDA